MPELNDPPQPLTEPIKNDVNFESRISILLNGSGSTDLNPIIGTNWIDLSDTPPDYPTTPDTGKGAALRVRFGMAESSETIRNASIYAVDEEGVHGPSTSLKSYFIKDIGNTQFYADFFVGKNEIIPCLGSGATNRYFIDIRTNLGRLIRQQVFTQAAQPNAVTVNGSASPVGSPVTIIVGEADGTPVNIPVSFFPGWNDELGRQHGIDITALRGNVRKPYGGMATVEIFKKIGFLPFPVSWEPFLSERPAHEVSSLEVSPSSPYCYTFLLAFRSKAGSDEGIGIIIEVCIEECGIIILSPPECSTDYITFTPADPSPYPYVPILPGNYGSTNGVPNTSMDVTIKGYVAGVIQGSPNQVVGDIPIPGSIVTNIPSTETEEQNINLTGDFADATLIIAEVSATAGGITTLGNTLVYRSGEHTDDGLPSAPVIEDASVSYNFVHNILEYNLDDLGGVAGTTVTAYVYPIYGKIKADDETLVTADLSVKWEAGSAHSGSETTIGDGKILICASAFAALGTPDAVMVYFTSSISGVGSATSASWFFDQSSGVTFGEVLSPPTISGGSVTGGDFRFSVDATGGQVPPNSYTLGYNIVNVSTGVVYTDEVTDTFTAVTGTKTWILPTSAPDLSDVDGFYMVYLIGIQGRSNTLTIDNTAS